MKFLRCLDVFAAFFQGFVIKTGSGMTDIMKFVILEFPKYEGSNMFPASPSFSVPGNDCFLCLRVFYFQPLPGAKAGNINAIRFFCHDAFQVFLSDLFKKSFSFFGDMIAVADHIIFL